LEAAVQQTYLSIFAAGLICINAEGRPLGRDGLTVGV